MKWLTGFASCLYGWLKQLSFIYFVNERQPKICWKENIEMNAFFNNDFLIWHLRPVKSNFDEIIPCSCVPTTYTYDSFIWLKDCEIQWHILFFCSRKQNVEKCVKQKETYIHCFNIRHCLVPSPGCERRRVVCRASDFAT